MADCSVKRPNEKWRAGTSSRSSFFKAVSLREIHPTCITARPFIQDFTSEGYSGSWGVIPVFGQEFEVPPFAVAFSQRFDASPLLAVADEEGTATIYDTHQLRNSLSSRTIRPNNVSSAQVQQWEAHQNAIFDIAWLDEDTSLLSASGDQTIRYSDVEIGVEKAVCAGHTGSVKSLSVCPCAINIFASGGRDGAVMLWDLRGRMGSGGALRPTAIIEDAHAGKEAVRSRRSRFADRKQSVTAVLFLRDDQLLATAGANDGVVKVWDARNLSRPIMQTPQLARAYAPTTVGKGRVYGVSALAQDGSGGRMIASCTDGNIYMYNTLRLDQGPTASFSGHQASGFYVKAAFSPDSTHIASGSADKKMYIWQVDQPTRAPYAFEGHDGEVTSVSWCPADFCRIATCSDDCTVRVWNIERPSEDDKRPNRQAPLSLLARSQPSTAAVSTSAEVHSPSLEETRPPLQQESAEAEEHRVSLPMKMVAVGAGMPRAAPLLRDVTNTATRLSESVVIRFSDSTPQRAFIAEPASSSEREAGPCTRAGSAHEQLASCAGSYSCENLNAEGELVLNKYLLDEQGLRCGEGETQVWSEPRHKRHSDVPRNGRVSNKRTYDELARELASSPSDFNEAHILETCSIALGTPARAGIKRDNVAGEQAEARSPVNIAKFSHSPTSVLSPPPSSGKKRRTIVDYFGPPQVPIR